MDSGAEKGEEAVMEEHNVEAYFVGGYGDPFYQPTLACSCGFRSRCESWEEAGSELDAHLATVLAEGK